MLTRMVFEYVAGFIEGYWPYGILFTMALESALVPIPSELVMPFAGYIAWKNGSIAMALEAALIAVLGNLLGSIALYYVGVYGGRPLILRYGKYFLVSKDEFERAEELFRRYEDYAVFLGRMMPAVRTVISFPAGVFEVSLGKFVVLTVLGSIPWNLALSLAGYAMGPYWVIIVDYSTYVDLAVMLGATLLIVWWLLRNRRR